jgi:hypothetical protein
MASRFKSTPETETPGAFGAPGVFAFPGLKVQKPEKRYPACLAGCSAVAFATISAAWPDVLVGFKVSARWLTSSESRKAETQKISGP